MSKRRDVMLAVKALATTALTDGGWPAIEIKGFDREMSADIRPGAGGTLLGWPGEMELLGTDLSPVRYNYRHPVPLQLLPPPGAAEPSAVLDAMMGVIGAAIVADRTLGGLCEWIEAEAPEEYDKTPEHAVTLRSANLAIVADYSTTDPLN